MNTTDKGTMLDHRRSTIQNALDLHRHVYIKAPSGADVRIIDVAEPKQGFVQVQITEPHPDQEGVPGRGWWVTLQGAHVVFELITPATPSGVDPLVHKHCCAQGRIDHHARTLRELSDAFRLTGNEYMADRLSRIALGIETDTRVMSDVFSTTYCVTDPVDTLRRTDLKEKLDKVRAKADA